MKVTLDKSEELEEYLRASGMYVQFDEYGAQIQYQFCGGWFTTCAPWDYDVTINAEDYPEVKLPVVESGANWF